MTAKIRPATSTDADAISALVTPLAASYIAHEFSVEGRRTLLGSLAPDAIRGYLERNFRYHVAEDSGDLVGVVATRDNNHLYHLFVAERSQGKGLARKLCEVAQQACREAGFRGRFTVHSSRFAVGFYEKLGFVRETEELRGGVSAVRMRQRKATDSSGAGEAGFDVR